MKTKRRKRELTAKQVKTIASIISIGIFLGAMIMDISHVKFNSIEFLIIERLGDYTLLLMFSIVIYDLILRLGKVPRKEDDDKIRADIMEMLSKTDFKEVYFQLTSTDHATMMLLDILEKEQVKFYAKLAEDDEGIILQCIDKHGDMVHESKITNFSYFEKIFNVS